MPTSYCPIGVPITKHQIKSLNLIRDRIAVDPDVESVENCRCLKDVYGNHLWAYFTENEILYRCTKFGSNNESLIIHHLKSLFDVDMINLDNINQREYPRLSPLQKEYLSRINA